ncbi:hypothetical protein GE21DRAFT_1122693 [Neurospora crassa]|nr:hypothetical protein GE21DRAFT_1122693 [Neurospora crassa]
MTAKLFLLFSLFDPKSNKDMRMTILLFLFLLDFGVSQKVFGVHCEMDVGRKERIIRLRSCRRFHIAPSPTKYGPRRHKFMISSSTAFFCLRLGRKLQQIVERLLRLFLEFGTQQARGGF